MAAPALLAQWVGRLARGRALRPWRLLVDCCGGCALSESCYALHTYSMVCGGRASLDLCVNHVV